MIYINGIGYSISNISALEKEDQGSENIMKAKALGYSNIYSATPQERKKQLSSSVKQALDMAKLSKQDIDCIVYLKSISYDYLFENEPSKIRKLLDMPEAGFVKLDQACNSSITALEYAQSCLEGGHRYDRILIVMHEYEVQPHFDRYNSFSTSIVSDGACAVVLSKKKSALMLLGTHIICDGQYNEIWRLLNSGTVNFSKDYREIMNMKFNVHKTGANIFNSSIKKNEMLSLLVNNNKLVFEKALKKNKLAKSDIDYLVTYNIGESVHEQIRNVLDIPVEKTSYDIGKTYGHIGAADVFINLSKAVEHNSCSVGNYIALFSAGIGFSWGVAIVRYDKS